MTAVSGDTLVMDVRVAGEMRVPVASVARMEVLRGGEPGKAIGLGILAGGLLGTGWGLSECAPGSSTCDTPLFLATGAVGGLVGGGVGLLIGVAHTWQPIVLTEASGPEAARRPALHLKLSIPAPGNR